MESQLPAGVTKALQHVPWLQNHSLKGRHSSCGDDCYVALFGETWVKDSGFWLRDSTDSCVCNFLKSPVTLGKAHRIGDPVVILTDWTTLTQNFPAKLFLIPITSYTISWTTLSTCPGSHTTWNQEQDRGNRVANKIPFYITVFPRNISLCQVSHGWGGLPRLPVCITHCWEWCCRREGQLRSYFQRVPVMI